jgi:hypothetical protein
LGLRQVLKQRLLRRAAPFLDTYLKDYIGKTLSAPDEAFAAESAKRRRELEAL